MTSAKSSWPDPSLPGYVIVRVSWLDGHGKSHMTGPWMTWNKSQSYYHFMPTSPTSFLMKCSKEFLEYTMINWTKNDYIIEELKGEG